MEAWWSSGYVHIRLRICRSRFKLCHGIVSFKVDADCFFFKTKVKGNGCSVKQTFDDDDDTDDDDDDGGGDDDED